MYYADEVRDFAAIDTEAAAPVRDKEVQLAEMLINELTENKFDPIEFHDEYRQRLMDKIEAKAQGKPVVSPQREEEAPGEVVDIMEALRRSLTASPRRERKAPQRAGKRPAAARKTRKAS
jgi:DNA end-binding protein Ku